MAAMVFFLWGSECFGLVCAAKIYLGPKEQSAPQNTYISHVKLISIKFGAFATTTASLCLATLGDTYLASIVTAVTLS